MAVLLFSVFAYAIGMAGLVLWIGWQLPWQLLPWHIDQAAVGPLAPALAVNVGLMLLFGLQHSVMARPAFKQRWTAVLAPPVERSVYVLLSGVLLVIIALCWQPLPGTAWALSADGVGWQLVAGVQLAGWGIAVLATFLINHFELFGLAQAWRHYHRLPEPDPHFTEVFLYRLVRHPLQFGILVGLWAVPVMSVTHLASSLLMTLYILIGLYFEERNLLQSLGADYADYQRRVPMLLPFPRPRRNPVRR